MGLCHPSLLMLTENNLFLSASTQPPFSFASDLAMRRENRIAADDCSVPLFPACVLPPKGCGCLCQALEPPFLPVFCLYFPLLSLRSQCCQQRLLGLRKACWAISWVPLPLLVLGKADKEQLGVAPRAPAQCRGDAPSPGPEASAALRVGAGRGARARTRCLPADTGRAAASPRLILEKHRPPDQIPVSPSFPIAGGLGLRGSKATFSTFPHQCF